MGEAQVLDNAQANAESSLAAATASIQPEAQHARLQAVIKERFRLHELIGTGLFSSVYRATDLRTRSEVALKLLSIDLRNFPKLLERLESSREACALIRETGVITPVSIEQHDSFSIVVTPLMTRDSLTNLLRARGPLPLKDVENIVSQVATTLDHLHARGLMHRALTPNNILFDSAGQACITDVGVTDDILMQCGIHGSLAARARTYAAPEQWRAQKIDGRVDQYALARIAYHMLTGGQREEQEIVEGVHTLSPVEVLAEVPLRKDVPLHVNAALRQALSANATNRFATASKFANAFAGRSPDAIPGMPTAYPDREVFRSRYRVLKVGGALMAVLIVAFALSPAVRAAVQRTGRALEGYLQSSRGQIHVTVDATPVATPSRSPEGPSGGSKAQSSGGAVPDRGPLLNRAGGSPTPGSGRANGTGPSGSTGSSPVTVKIGNASPDRAFSSTTSSSGLQGMSVLERAWRDGTSWLKRVFSGPASHDQVSQSAYIQVSVDRGSAIVTVDGLPRGAAPVTVLVSAGHHTISALGALNYGAIEGVNATVGDTTRVVLRGGSTR
jgi:eukaryotic-like serine/threonine-protein kinase